MCLYVQLRFVRPRVNITVDISSVCRKHFIRISKNKKSLNMKLEFTALAFVILHRLVIAHDFNHLSRCPEYNPQNELDIDLVS